MVGNRAENGSTVGCVIWFTGFSGSGKTTLGERLDAELRRRGQRVELLDGDVVRTHLSKGLGFSRQDRDTNILRIGFVCGLLARNDVIAIATAISPYRATREAVRASVERFVEVFVDCPLSECVRRDVKGLYRQAMAGEIAEFTGVSDPYEPPLHPEITIASDQETADESAARILAWLERHNYIPQVAPLATARPEVATSVSALASTMASAAPAPMTP